MKEFSLLLTHLLTVFAKLLGPGGIKGIIAESIRLKQQLLVVRRSRRPAYDVILDIFEYTGDVKQRPPYEMVCAAAPVTNQA